MHTDDTWDVRTLFAYGNMKKNCLDTLIYITTTMIIIIIIMIIIMLTIITIMIIVIIMNG